MIVMTEKLAHSAGWDAANRLMRAKGIARWDEECWNVAAETFHRLYGCQFIKSINNGICPECNHETQRSQREESNAGLSAALGRD